VSIYYHPWEGYVVERAVITWQTNKWGVRRVKPKIENIDIKS